MPVPLTPDTVTTSTLPSFDYMLRDQFFMSTALGQFLIPNVEPVNGGLNITYEVLYTKSNNATNYPGGLAEVDPSFQGNSTNAVLPCTYYIASVAVPDTTLIQNAGAAKIIDLLEAQYEHALTSLMDTLGADMYSDGTVRNNAPVISGLNAICTNGADPTPGPYAGISRVGSSGAFNNQTGQAAWWNAPVLTINGGSQTVYKGTLNTGALTTVNFQALFAAYLAGCVGQFRPEAIITDILGFQGFGNLTQQSVRQVASNEIYALGPQAMQFCGIPVMQDDQCPSGTAYFINNLLKLRGWVGGFFARSTWRQPPTSLVQLAYILVMVQMQHKRPNTMVKLSGITG